ncbi:MAG: hypothetical protein HYY01_14410 [Chloroflexi bacterium]|nr:hypothetical protein [Chloroflexota bacterium]
MALKDCDIELVIQDIVQWREFYSYWPIGQPSRWETYTDLRTGWMALLGKRYEDAPLAVCSQALVRELERRYMNAVSRSEKAEAVWLVRCWKAPRRMDEFATEYRGDSEHLAVLWDSSAEVAEHPEQLKLLNLPEIGIPVATTLSAFASGSRSLGVLDLVMADSWARYGWVPFKVRKDKGGKSDYLKDKRANWRLYGQYVEHLRQIAAALEGVSFVDASTRQPSAFCPRDVEMALHQRFRMGGRHE